MLSRATSSEPTSNKRSARSAAPYRSVALGACSVALITTAALYACDRHPSRPSKSSSVPIAASVSDLYSIELLPEGYFPAAADVGATADDVSVGVSWTGGLDGEGGVDDATAAPDSDAAEERPAARREDDDAERDAVTLTLADGSVYIGETNFGLRHGRGVNHFTNGDVYEGEWRNGMMHGLGRVETALGDVYDGSWEASERHGHGAYSWDNGDSYVGEWRRGKQHGAGTYTENGIVFEGAWKENVAFMLQHTLEDGSIDRIL